MLSWKSETVWTFHKNATVEPFHEKRNSIRFRESAKYNPLVENQTEYHIGLKPTIAVEDGKIWLYRVRHASKGSRESVMSWVPE